MMGKIQRYCSLTIDLSEDYPMGEFAYGGLFLFANHVLQFKYESSGLEMSSINVWRRCVKFLNKEWRTRSCQRHDTTNAFKDAVFLLSPAHRSYTAEQHRPMDPRNCGGSECSTQQPEAMRGVRLWLFRTRADQSRTNNHICFVITSTHIRRNNFLFS